MDVIYTDADGIPTYADRASIAVLSITRAEVERGTTGDVVDRLMAFTDSTALVDAFEGRLAILVGGYDDDPRELWQIPAVCAFFRMIDRSWSFWAHFAMHEIGTASLIAALLCDSELVAHANGNVYCGFVDQEEGDRLVVRLGGAVGALYAAHGRTQEAARQTIERFHRALHGSASP